MTFLSYMDVTNYCVMTYSEHAVERARTHFDGIYAQNAMADCVLMRLGPSGSENDIEREVGRMEEQELEKQVLETIEKDNRAKRKLNLRTAFLVRHGGWIELLNEREKLVVAISDTMTSAFEKWQCDNFLTVQIDEPRVKGSMVKFSSEREFVSETVAWAYNNLKAISRGAKELQPIGKIGQREVNALLKYVQPSVWFSPDKDGKVICRAHQGYAEDGDLPALGRLLYCYLEYIEQALSGLKGKAKVGVFKVVVCPYHRLGRPECGRVEVVTSWNGEACKKHQDMFGCAKWRAKNPSYKRTTGFLKKDVAKPSQIW